MVRIFFSFFLILFLVFSANAEVILKTNNCKSIKFDNYYYSDNQFCTKKNGEKFCINKNEIVSVVKILPDGEKRVTYNSETKCGKINENEKSIRRRVEEYRRRGEEIMRLKKEAANFRKRDREYRLWHTKSSETSSGSNVDEADATISACRDFIKTLSIGGYHPNLLDHIKKMKYNRYSVCYEEPDNPHGISCFELSCTAKEGKRGWITKVSHVQVSLPR